MTSSMSYEKRKKALIFLKEQCGGTIKAQACADGRSQMEYTTKE